MGRGCLSGMGEGFEFRCAGCGYRAEVSGGSDAGALGYVHTVSCRTCRPARLVDASPRDGAMATEPIEDVCVLVCPHERTRAHRIALWTHPGRCPRCEAEMVRGESVGLWD